MNYQKHGPYKNMNLAYSQFMVIADIIKLIIINLLMLQSSMDTTVQNPTLNMLFEYFQKALLLWYALMSFFKEPASDPNFVVTTAIGVIKLPAYSALETVTMIALVMLRLKNQKKMILSFNALLTLIVLGFNIRYWVNGTYWPAGLIARPLFLSIYKSFSRRTMLKYLIIFQRSIVLFILMWFSLVFWSSLGYYLYGQQQLDVPNSFGTPSEAIFQTFVMQTTANYPDIGLPYVDKQKTNVLFFILVIIIHTMLINNMIVATNYNNFKELADQQYIEQSFFLLLYNLVLDKRAKTKQKWFLLALDQTSRYVLDVLQSKILHFCLFLYTMVLFYIISFMQGSRAGNTEAIFLLVLNLIIFCINLIEGIIYKRKFWRNHGFEIYEFVTSLICIFAYITRSPSTGSNDTNFQYTTLIVVRIPKAFQFVLSFVILFSESLLRFLRKFQEVAYMLFIVSLMFAGIGEIAFGGVNTMDASNTLNNAGINPYYVYLNFNNTLTSFFTLFALLIVNNNNAITTVYTVLLQSNAPRVFFLLYYMMGTQTAYSLVLASIIDHIIEERERFKNMEEYDGSRCIEFLTHKKEILRVWECLIAEFTRIYGKNHRKIHPFHSAEEMSYNFPDMTLEEGMEQQEDCYTLVQFKNHDIEEACLQVATSIKTDIKLQPQILTINAMLNTIKDESETWPILSVLQILKKNGLWNENKLIFDQLVTEKLKSLKIQVELEHNNVLTLVEHLIEEPGYLYFVNYDLPLGFVRNTSELYVKGQRVAFGFYYIFQSKEYYIEKIRLRTLSEYFGKLEAKAATTQRLVTAKQNLQTQKMLLPDQNKAGVPTKIIKQFE